MFQVPFFLVSNVMVLAHSTSSESCDYSVQSIESFVELPPTNDWLCYPRGRGSI